MEQETEALMLKGSHDRGRTVVVLDHDHFDAEGVEIDGCDHFQLTTLDIDAQKLESLYAVGAQQIVKSGDVNPICAEPSAVLSDGGFDSSSMTAVMCRLESAEHLPIAIDAAKLGSTRLTTDCDLVTVTGAVGVQVPEDVRIRFDADS